MCAIFGFSAKDASRTDAYDVVYAGLSQMEYRGYDSCGIALSNSKLLHWHKSVGKLSNLSEMYSFAPVGIGHTRWATHGKVSIDNAHPIISDDNSFAVVHNGTIDNYKDIVPEAECDTEAIVKLIEKNTFFSTATLPQGVERVAMMKIHLVLPELKGTFAFACLRKDGAIILAKRKQPLLIGWAEEGIYFSSDVSAFPPSVYDCVEMNDECYGVINNGVLEFSSGLWTGDVRHVPLPAPQQSTMFPLGQALSQHNTLTEIYDQAHTIPIAYQNNEEELSEFAEAMKYCDVMRLVGSGSSYNACLIGERLFSYHKIDVHARVAGQGRFYQRDRNNVDIVVALSQSGETFDVLEAVKELKKANYGVKVFSLTNNSNSSLARISDVVLQLGCGVERGVAATKSFTSQVVLLDRMTSRYVSPIIASLDANFFPMAEVCKASHEMKDCQSLYLIGETPYAYALALEGALKIKELALIHAEALPACELKHGPLALIDDKSWIIAVDPQGLISNMPTYLNQAKARGAKVVGVSNIKSELYDKYIPCSFNHHSGIIPLQMLSYRLAVDKGINPDFPRNLAKSCTTK